jgi:hypothetical protein
MLTIAAGNVAGDNRMTGRDGRTLEPSDNHFLQRIPLVVRSSLEKLAPLIEKWAGPIKASGVTVESVHDN